MATIGFIGYGHMGSVLLSGFLASGAVEPREAVVATRTSGRLDSLRSKYPEVRIAKDNREAAKAADILFLCVGTYQVKTVLAEIRDFFRKGGHLVFISGGLEIGSVETLYGGPVTKLIPTLLAEVREGCTLVCHCGLIDRVSTKGGATEGGMRVLAETLPDVFARVFSATGERHEKRKRETRAQFVQGDPAAPL